MSIALRRHNNKKWKARRADKFGHKCSRAKCGICSRHKRLGNSKEAILPKYREN